MDSRSNGSKDNNFKGNKASDRARQHNGNVFNNYENYYNLRQRRSDETLREDGRNQALINAASEGQTPRVKHLLQLRAEIDYTDEYGLAALHHAALSGFHDTVSAVLEAGADVNADSLDCGTPLHLAALKGRSHVVRLLLASRADLSRRSRMIGTALHCVCYAGDLVVMDELCSHGADVAALDIVRLPLLSSIHTAGVFPSTGWPRPLTPDFRYEYVECQPWHMAFLGNNDSVLVFAPTRLSALHEVPKAWDIKLVQNLGSNITSVHRIEPLNVLKVLVDLDNSKILHTLLVDSTFAPIEYDPLAGYNALRAAVPLERVDCVKLLLRSRARFGLEQDVLDYFAGIAHNDSIRDMLRDPNSTAPVLTEVRREHMSIRAPRCCGLPWEYDGDDPEYIVIRQEITDSQANLLFEVTKMFRSGE